LPKTPAEINHHDSGDDIPLPPEPDWPAVDSGPHHNDHRAAGEGDDEGAVMHRLHVLRINHEAKRRLDDETRPPIALPPIKSLDALLDEPETPTRYRIESVAPANARVMLSAQQKSGKTTLVDNVIRALVDAEPLLGQFAVNTPSSRLVLLDDELSEDMLRRWLRDQHIGSTNSVATVSLRGRVGSFNLLDERSRAAWAQRFRDLGCDYLILDCLRPVLDALGLDEKNVGPFLVAFDALLAEAGIDDALLVHHMGHTNERARGDSRLLDWPDATWRLVRETDEPNSPRYFSAYGRDVNVREGRLSFDPTTRRLSYAAGSRADTRTESAVSTVVDLLVESGGEGMGVRDLEAALADADHPRQAARDAIKHAVKQGLVTIEHGARRAKIHRIANPCAQCGRPVAGGGSRHQSCSSLSEEGLFE
jgi:hypothetical protein